MDRILLIDGHNYIYRACVKFGKVQQDVLDEVIFTFNFFRNLRATIADFEPEKVFFVLEGHPQFRYNLYPEYKAHRFIKRGVADTLTPAQISRQKSVERFEKTKDIVLLLLPHLPITIARAANYEADDTVNTLVYNMKDEDITVMSSDSDFIQILQMGYKNIRVYDPIKKQDMEAPPYPYVAWKCLAGDKKSDNIPAILKPKKALDTISNPELFKNFLELEENRANFNINRQLIEFRLAPLEEIEIKEGSCNFPALYDAFVGMKFESITNEQSWNKFKSTFDCIKY